MMIEKFRKRWAAAYQAFPNSAGKKFRLNTGIFMKKYIAELIGTFVLVFGGCGAAVLAGDHIGFLGVSFAFGLTLLTMAYAIGPISGCHINPAVTIGLFLSKKISAKDVPGYIIAQILGGILGAAILLIIVKGMPGGYDPALSGFAANGYGEHSPGGFNVTSAFVVEVVLTFFLVLTVLGSTDLKAPVGFAGIPIGLVLVLIHLVGIPVTNTSVNPARSISQAVFVGGWALGQLWLFILAPIVGAVLASIIFRGIGTEAPVMSVQKAERALDSEVAERSK
jgi:aquaporin Z